MSARRPRLLTRKVRRHGVKPPSQIENPAKSWEFIRHMYSPWALIALWLFQICLLVLIMILYGYAHQFSDYLNQRGDYANRARAEENQAICDLISQLRADPGGQLQKIADRLQCDKGPLPMADNMSISPSSVPIGPGTPYFTSSPTRSSQSPTGAGGGVLAGGNRPLGTKVPASPSAVPRPTPAQTTTPPASTSSTVPAGGGASPSPPPPQLVCIPLTSVCVPL